MYKLHLADFLEPGASFITKYRFDKDGKFVISVTSDIQYISALLKEELGSYRHCGEQDSSECCIALKFGLLFYNCCNSNVRGIYFNEL